MKNKAILWNNLFSNFQTRKIESREIEKIIKEAVDNEHPNDPIENLEYNEDGMEVILKSGTIIKIKIDWNEIILT